ncbi:39S ribosomal protein L10, mitochondrial [Spea bombifrons]|uniref:39S ribosomal protein L10, mitochondrial n=1 Tax=Spea bombifrons TaxID=233779 RepID=UPI00234A73A5|nr:39S ribosomal protein L10, mitochondrial [Spea bombifrons]
MATALVRRAVRELGRLPSLQSVRHGSKAVTRHRKAMHFERQKMLAVTEYIPPKPAIPEECLAPKSRRTHIEEDNPLVRLLCSQLNSVLQECKMVAVFQRNAVGSEDLLLLRHGLLKHGIQIKHFPNQVVKKSLVQCQLQAMEPLFIGQTFLIVSRDVKVKEMLQNVRKVPQVELLGACIERRLLSRQGVMAYAKMPSLESLQGQVVGTLSAMAAQTCSLLAQHSTQLCSNLEQHIKEQSAEEKST